MVDKVTTMHDAIATYAHDGDVVAIEGFTACICFAVVHEPYGAHPSYVQGYYDRDNEFYLRWDEVGRDEAAVQSWLEEWVWGVRDRAEYVEKMGPQTWERLAAKGALAGPVDYGEYV